MADPLKDQALGAGDSLARFAHPVHDQGVGGVI